MPSTDCMVLIDLDKHKQTPYMYLVRKRKKMSHVLKKKIYAFSTSGAGGMEGDHSNVHNIVSWYFNYWLVYMHISSTHT